MKAQKKGAEGDAPGTIELDDFDLGFSGGRVLTGLLQVCVSVWCLKVILRPSDLASMTDALILISPTLKGRLGKPTKAKAATGTAPGPPAASVSVVPAEYKKGQVVRSRVDVPPRKVHYTLFRIL